MRLPRKFSRALPTEDVLSPAAAAQQAAQGGIRTAIVAGAAAGVINQQIETNRQLEAAEDNLAKSGVLAEAKSGADNWQNDPKYDIDVQPDGRPTPEVMREDYGKLREQIMGSVDRIQNPLERERFRSQLEDTLTLLEPTVEKTITNRRMGIVIKNTRQAMDDLIAAGAFDEARAMLADSSEKFQTIADDAARINEIIDKSEISWKGEKIAESVAEQYRISKEAGDKAYSDLVLDEDMDSDVRNAALPAANRYREAAFKAREQERNAQMSQWIQNLDDAIANPPPNQAGVDALFESEEWGPTDTRFAARARGRVMAAVATNYAKNTVVNSIKAHVATDTMLDDTKQMREGLELVEEEMLEGIDDPEERMRRQLQLYRTAGTVPQYLAVQFANSGKSVENMKQMLPLFMALSSGDVQPNLHLGESEAVMQYAALLGGTDQAAELAFASTKDVPPEEITARKEQYNMEGIKAAEQSFEDYVDDNDFKFANDADRDRMMADWNASHRAAHMTVGDMQSADNVAASQSKWVMTNINGKYVAKRHGIPNDSTPIRTMLNEVFSEFDEYVVSTGTSIPLVSGEIQTMPFDPETVEYRVVDMDGETRVMAPFVNGQPLSRLNAGVWEVAQFPVTKSDIDAAQDQYTRIRSNIEQLRKAERDERYYTDYLNAAAGFPSGAVPEHMIEDAKTELERIGQQIEILSTQETLDAIEQDRLSILQQREAAMLEFAKIAGGERMSEWSTR